MAEFNDSEDSAKSLRWKCLVDLAEMLSKGEADLDQLMIREVKGKKRRENGVDHDHLLDHGTFKKKNKNRDVVCTEKPVSWQIAIKKPSGDAQETSTPSERAKILYKNPSFSGKGNCVDHDPLPDRGTIFKKENNSRDAARKIVIKKPSYDAPETSRSHDRAKILDGKLSFNGKIKMEVAPMSEKRVKKRTEIAKVIQNPGPAPALPEAVKKHILDSGSCLESAVLVIEKVLTETDLNPGHCRFAIPHGKIMNPFLQPSEVDLLDNTLGGISVNLLQPCLEECQMSLRSWKKTYALVKDWKAVCCRNELVSKMIVQLWSFRRNGALCFALVHIGQAP